MKKVISLLLTFLLSAGMVYAEMVSFNVNSHKIHKLSCRYAFCKNCIKIDKKEAIRRGGIPCKVCG